MSIYHGKGDSTMHDAAVDPKYEHWIDREAKGMVSGHNIRERSTSECPGVDGAKSFEASPAKPNPDFFRGATEKDCEDSAYEAESMTEIEQIGYDHGKSERSARRKEREEYE